MRFFSLSRRRRPQLAIAASLIIHLLAISAYQRWATDEVARLLRPVQMQPMPAMDEPDRFRPSAPGRLPRAAMERLRSETELPPLPTTPLLSGDEPPLPDLHELSARTDDALTARGKKSLPREQELVDRDAMMMEAIRRKKAQRDRRWLLALPDADTTDQESRTRGIAEAIIDSAIVAMGGLERLQAVTDKTVQVWFYDSRGGRWKRSEKRYYWRGLRFREDIQRAIARGFDGSRSWYSRFGLSLPAPDLRREAERWDFLSLYKEDGILLQYLGRSPGSKAEHVIRVTDIAHGRQWEAFFDPRSHLLAAIREGQRLTEYKEYRQVGDILMPYELWVQSGPHLAVYRHVIYVNAGMDLDLFVAPQPRSWSRESVRMVVLEHVGEDLADSTFSLKIRPIWQKPPPSASIMMDGLSLDLLNTYLLEEFRAAGIAAEGEEDRWLEVVIDAYYVGSQHQLILTATLREVSDRGWVWSEEMEYVWTPPRGALPINDKVGDAITFQLLTRVGRGLTVLLDLPVAGLADSPARPAFDPAAAR